MTSGGPDSALRRTLADIASTASHAPSKHNAQPWRFLVREEALEVWPDPMRALPGTDPHSRELVIGCATAAETALVLARAEGLDVVVDVLPDGTAGPILRLRVRGTRPSTGRDRALADAVLARHTDRGPLDATRLPAEAPFLLQEASLGECAQLVLVTTEGQRRALSRLLLEADHRLAGTCSATEEVTTWSRPAGSPARDGVPSSSSRGAAASYGAAFVQRDFSLPGSVPAHARAGTDRPLIGVITTRADTAADWVAAGRALARVLLEVTLAGGNASFLNQVVEVAQTRLALRQELDIADWPQLVLRLGVGGDVDVTARRLAHDVVVQVR